MKTKRLKRVSLVNLIFGYLVFFIFVLLMMLNIPNKDVSKTVEITNDKLPNGTTFQASSSPHEILELKTSYIAPVVTPPIVVENNGHRDRDRVRDNIAIVDTADGIIFNEVGSRHVYQDKLIGGKTYNEEISDGNNHAADGFRGNLNGIHSIGNGVHDGIKDGFRNVDHGLLERRLAERRLAEPFNQRDRDQVRAKDKTPKASSGLNEKDKSLDFSQFTVAREGDDAALGDIDTAFNENGKGYGVGKGGELYAYNFPSQGVGAGIGSSAVGAGAGGGAGLSAGIGEGILNGETVPTLGGVGDGAKSVDGEPSEAAGVGGLLGGAGAGGTAGLTQGYITSKLGVGVGNGVGGAGGHGNGRHYNYDHLPKDGALHIMMHVDGSGSILNTRKQLQVMKDSLLKEALLPYYNNDLDLYNRRVTIVDNSGERTLRFFTEAAQKNNVLAIAFQDEAQPAYHLPNFNRKPEDHYLTDLKALKSKLGNHKGIYRGVLFQVDRGRTFARSFKEFMGNAFHGTGYLSSDNLKNYHRDNNSQHIKNKDGVVFSDEYHAKDEGTPEYYLDLLFNASRKVGLDLNVYKGGLTDGKDIKNSQ